MKIVKLGLIKIKQGRLNVHFVLKALTRTRQDLLTVHLVRTVELTRPTLLEQPLLIPAKDLYFLTTLTEKTVF